MPMNEWTKVRIRQFYSEDVSWEGSGQGVGIRAVPLRAELGPGGKLAGRAARMPIPCSGYIFDAGYLYEIQINNQTIFSEINTRPFTHDNVQVCRQRDEFCIFINKI